MRHSCIRIPQADSGRKAGFADKSELGGSFFHWIRKRWMREAITVLCQPPSVSGIIAIVLYLCPTVTGFALTLAGLDVHMSAL